MDCEEYGRRASHAVVAAPFVDERDICGHQTRMTSRVAGNTDPITLELVGGDINEHSHKQQRVSSPPLPHTDV